MRKKVGISLLILAMGMGLSSCVVSKKKYDQLASAKKKSQSQLQKSRRELADEKEKSESLKKDMLALEGKLKDCGDEKAKLEAKIKQLKRKGGSLQEEYDDLKASCTQLDDNYKSLKNKNTKKIKDLLNQLESLQADLREREARLAEVEKALNERDELMNALKKRVSDALLGFEQDGLTVEVRNGKVYVSLSNKLLFASGSTTIDETGKSALKELATVLVDNKDLNIMVEGHTDDVPVSNLGQIKDNWDLSVMRSTEVVRILVENGLESTRVIPSGRSEFIPKVAGKSTEARATNRRTEIIISPKLDELYELINKSDS